MNNTLSIMNELISSLYRFCIFILVDIILEIKEALTTHVFNIFSFRRLISLCILIPLVSFCIVWNHIGFLMDDIFFPQWRNQVVTTPLFIIGNARSGTTLCHRLLSSHTTQFTSIQLWEILFATSVSWRLLFHIIYSIDQIYFSHILFTCIQYINNRIFGSFYVHPCGLFHIEEDEWLMIHICCCQLILLFFPMGLRIPPSYSSIPSLPSFETQLLDTMKLYIFQYYKTCIQRHVYAHTILLSNNKSRINSYNSQNDDHISTINHKHVSKLIYISKNPTFTTRLQTLHRIFPDCRILCMIRDPIESIPSMVSYISIVWHVTNQVHSQYKYPNTEELLGFCIDHYLYPIQFSKSGQLLPYQFINISYSHLLKTPTTTIPYILQHLYTDENGDYSTTGYEYYYQYLVEIEKKYKQKSNHSHSSDSNTNSNSSNDKGKNEQQHHNYSVETCCNMSSTKLKEMMKSVYEIHQDILINSKMMTINT